MLVNVHVCYTLNSDEFYIVPLYNVTGKYAGGEARMNPDFSVTTNKLLYSHCSRTRVSVFTALQKIVYKYVGAVDY